MTPLAWTLALLIGITLGLLGGGGSILTVPVFVYVMGLDPKAAIAMSLPVVGGAALVGVVRHWALGNVALRTALPFGLAAMAAAFLGARVARYIPGTAQLVILGLVMAAAAASMLRPPRLGARAGSPGADDPPAGAPVPAPLRRAELLALGALVGALTGIVGVGGGFLIVPALVVLGGMPMTHAVGTSLLVIAMNTLTGFIGYAGTVAIDWGVVLRFGGAAAAGILVGSALTTRVGQQALRKAFALLLFIVAALILWQSIVASR